MKVNKWAKILMGYTKGMGSVRNKDATFSNKDGYSQKDKLFVYLFPLVIDSGEILLVFRPGFILPLVVGFQLLGTEYETY